MHLQRVRHRQQVDSSQNAPKSGPGHGLRSVNAGLKAHVPDFIQHLAGVSRLVLKLLDLSFVEGRHQIESHLACAEECGVVRQLLPDRVKVHQSKHTALKALRIDNIGRFDFRFFCGLAVSCLVQLLPLLAIANVRCQLYQSCQLWCQSLPPCQHQLEISVDARLN